MNISVHHVVVELKNRATNATPSSSGQLTHEHGTSVRINRYPHRQANCDDQDKEEGEDDNVNF